MTSEPLPHWDLSNVYPGLESEAFQQAMDEAGKLLDELDAYLAATQIGRGGPVPADAEALASTMGGYLERMNAAARQIWTLTQLHLFLCGNRLVQHRWRGGSCLYWSRCRYALRSKRCCSRAGWARSPDSPRSFEAALAVAGPAAEHAFYLREAAEQSRYLMSAEEESLAAELSLSGANAWGKLQGDRCVPAQGAF